MGTIWQVQMLEVLVAGRFDINEHDSTYSNQVLPKLRKEGGAMVLKKIIMANMGRCCSNCANCEPQGGLPVRSAACESPRMMVTVYDCEKGKIRKMAFDNCRNIYGTWRCKWKAAR
jgi:hypothetical protein